MSVSPKYPDIEPTGQHLLFPELSAAGHARYNEFFGGLAQSLRLAIAEIFVRIEDTLQHETGLSDIGLPASLCERLAGEVERSALAGKVAPWQMVQATEAIRALVPRDYTRPAEASGTQITAEEQLPLFPGVSTAAASGSVPQANG